MKEGTVNIMKQLEWLESDWLPITVTHHKSKVCSIGMSNEDFDNYQSMQYGYESYNDMITQMNKKHQNDKIKYGELYIKGWM